MIILKMKKLQYDINREVAKILALSPGKIDKFEYLTGEEILQSDQSRILEQANFTYSPWGKAFEIQIKTIEEQGRKQVVALEVLKPEETRGKQTKRHNIKGWTFSKRYEN